MADSLTEGPSDPARIGNPTRPAASAAPLTAFSRFSKPPTLVARRSPSSSSQRPSRRLTAPLTAFSRFSKPPTLVARRSPSSSSQRPSRRLTPHRSRPSAAFQNHRLWLPDDHRPVHRRDQAGGSPHRSHLMANGRLINGRPLRPGTDRQPDQAGGYRTAHGLQPLFKTTDFGCQTITVQFIAETRPAATPHRSHLMANGRLFNGRPLRPGTDRQPDQAGGYAPHRSRPSATFFQLVLDT